MRFSFRDLILFILIFIFTIAFPVDLIPMNVYLQRVVAIGLRLLLLAFFIYVMLKNRVKIFGIANIKNILLCLPFFLVCFSNIFATIFSGNAFNLEKFNVWLFLLDTLLCLVTAINEEIVFRFMIHNSLSATSSIKRIFGSAGIFALMHLLNIVNISSVGALVAVLLQTVYTFGLGILLGFLYEYGYSLLSCVLLHFMFNFVNDCLFAHLGCTPTALAYYLCAICIGVAVGVYVTLLYFFYFRKTSRYFRQ